MAQLRDKCRVTAVRGLLIATAGLALVAAPLPTAAAPSGVAPEVATARGPWQATVATLEEADAAVAQARDEHAAATQAMTVSAAALAEQERRVAAKAVEAQAANDRHDHARRQVTIATGELMGALRARDHGEVALSHRSHDLATAAVHAYVHGDPTMALMNGLMQALSEGGSVSRFLAAVERLGYVTVDARASVDAASAELRHRDRRVAVGVAALEQRQQDEGQAAEAAAAAEEALAAQRGARARARADHDAVAASVDAAQAAFEQAEAARVEAELARAEALAVLRSLGWRAGVPGSEELVWPVDGAPTSGFGLRTHPIHGDKRMHLGVDVPAVTGRPVVAAAAGKVVAAGERGGYGLAVIVDHGGQRSTLYAHLSAVAVRRGQWVAEAQTLGAVGSTGMSTGPHLHFEVRERGRHRDPLELFGP